MKMMLRMDQRYSKAVLTAGTILEDVTIDRFDGYDTTIWVTDGKVAAPRDAVVKLVK